MYSPLCYHAKLRDDESDFSDRIRKYMHYMVMPVHGFLGLLRNHSFSTWASRGHVMQCFTVVMLT
eukprot:3635661-Amphidinium_carterae.1